MHAYTCASSCAWHVHGMYTQVRFCDEDVLFLRQALEGLPPDLALFPTPIGELRGKTCGLS